MGSYDQAAVLKFDQIPDTKTTRGHHYKIRRPVSRTNLGHFRFSSRITSDWNSLPEDVVQAPSID